MMSEFGRDPNAAGRPADMMSVPGQDQGRPGATQMMTAFGSGGDAQMMSEFGKDPNAQMMTSKKGWAHSSRPVRSLTLDHPCPCVATSSGGAVSW